VLTQPCSAHRRLSFLLHLSRRFTLLTLARIFPHVDDDDVVGKGKGERGKVKLAAGLKRRWLESFSEEECDRRSCSRSLLRPQPPPTLPVPLPGAR
jgi:type II secretory pathway component PulK